MFFFLLVFDLHFWSSSVVDWLMCYNFAVILGL